MRPGRHGLRARRSARLRAVTFPAAPRRPSTKALLIDAGERLFGHYGFDGISLREISAAAGQSNSHAVQYHFKNKSGLIGAILEDRVGRVETLRRAQLAALGSEAALQPGELLKVMWLPIMSIKDANGVHTFCRFMLQYMLQPNLVRHPLARFDHPSDAGGRDGLSGLATAMRMLSRQYDHVPHALFDWRISALYRMFLAIVVEADNTPLSGKRARRAELNIEPILAVSIAALAAPV